MKKRPVTIHRLEIVSWAPPEAVIQVRCSAGTYVRSLARDIALAAGSRAYLGALKRTGVGGFLLEEAVEDRGKPEELVKALRPLDRKLFETLRLPFFLIDNSAAEGFKHGKALEKILAEGDFFSAGDEGRAGFPRQLPADAAPEKQEPVAAGVFEKKAPGEEPQLLGVIERRSGKWNYGYGYAGS